LTSDHDAPVALGDSDGERGAVTPFSRVDVDGVDVLDV